MSFFPLENRNVLIFSGFETQKSGQFRLNYNGWQVWLSCFAIPLSLGLPHPPITQKLQVLLPRITATP